MCIRASKKLVTLLLLSALLVMMLLPGFACDIFGEEKPEAGFSAEPRSGAAPLEVTFTDRSEGEIDDWEWDFGDGGTSTDQNPAYTYETPGLYTVSLTVTGPDGSDTETKTNYINASAYDWPEMTLVMQTPYPETDITGLAATRFKELLEEYTDGNITVDLFFNGILFEYQDQFEVLRCGDLDLAVENPGWVRDIDPNLDPIGTLPGIVVNLEHGRAVIHDPAIQAFMVDKYAEHDIRFLGYIENDLLGGYLSLVELTDFADLNGLKYYVPWQEPVDPLENMFGVIPWYHDPNDPIPILYFPDIIAIPITSAYDRGIYHLFDYYLMRVVYTPSSILMSLDTWNGMPRELQELISNTVMPQVQEYVKDVVIDHHKAAALGLKENMDAIHVVPMEREQEVWELLQTREDFLERKAWLAPEIVALIEALRPSSPTMDEEVIEILVYAGIPIPE